MTTLNQQHTVLFDNHRSYADERTFRILALYFRQGVLEAPVGVLKTTFDVSECNKGELGIFQISGRLLQPATLNAACARKDLTAGI
jgi:hypothetical protein